MHEVHFYGDDSELAASVGSFLGDGLAAGCPAVVVATPAHRAAFGARLGARAAEAGAAQAGRLVMVDAGAMLASILAGDRLDPARFRDAALDLIGRTTRPGQPVRIYAEMVTLLWEAGQVTRALELEALWNGLAADLPFCLLCGYPARLLAQQGEEEALAQVRRLHSGVVSPHPRSPGTTAVPLNGTGAVRGFPPERDSARRARYFVVGHLGPRADPAATADAAIITGELAANAVLHARSAFTVAISHPPGRIRISVSDATPLDDGPPLAAHPGHGLDVVAQLAVRWAARPRPGGKVVWAELPAAPPR